MKTKPDFRVRVPVYDQSVRVFTSQKRLNRWLEAKGSKERVGDSAYAWTTYADVPDGRRLFVLYVPKDCRRYSLAHETVHLAWFVLDHVGVPVEMATQETLAYLVGFLFRKVSRRLRKA